MMINTRSSVSLSNQEEPRQHELARHHVMNVVDGMNQVSIHLLMTSVSEALILNNHVTFSIAIMLIWIRTINKYDSTLRATSCSLVGLLHKEWINSSSNCTDVLITAYQLYWLHTQVDGCTSWLSIGMIHENDMVLPVICFALVYSDHQENNKWLIMMLTIEKVCNWYKRNVMLIKVFMYERNEMMMDGWLHSVLECRYDWNIE